MTDNALKIIKDEIERLNEIANGFLKTDKRNDTVIRLTKSLIVAVDALDPMTSGDGPFRISKRDETIKYIAYILKKANL